MKLHRFYVGTTELTHSFWMKDAALVHQWTKVLRFQPGREVVLFDCHSIEKMYRIEEIGVDAVKLTLITEMVVKKSKRVVYVCFSLLKKDKNDWVLQKGTELGASHFVPIISARTEKTGFDVERAHKILIEATEQSGRSDVPTVREPMQLAHAMNELSKIATIVVAEQGSGIEGIDNNSTAAVFIGPEGGWSEEEMHLFTSMNAHKLALSDFTLRAETANVVAVARLLGAGTF